MAKGEGCQILCGGSQPDRSQPEYAHLPPGGYFFLPTVLDHCNRDMKIVQAETFGPILTVERFKDGDEETAVRRCAWSSALAHAHPSLQIALANDTKFGLGGGVQTSDAARAKRLARRIRHGTMWTNTYGAYTPRAEWGGFGMSGNGRELGKAGL
jgi:betaine-aldehyde dehydrogenase